MKFKDLINREHWRTFTRRGFEYQYRLIEDSDMEGTHVILRSGAYLEVTDWIDDYEDLPTFGEALPLVLDRAVRCLERMRRHSVYNHDVNEDIPW